MQCLPNKPKVKSKAKIQIDSKFFPPESEVDQYVKNSVTLSYWEISLAWNNRISSNTTVSDALGSLGQIQSACPNESHLNRHAFRLQQEIIHFGSKKEMLRKNPLTKSKKSIGLL